MKIYDDPSDQCLLCIGYDFTDDYPLHREFSLRRYHEGVRQKEWWRYNNAYLGLKTWVAYHGAKPVGHIELIPVEHAPRPIVGQNLMVINCLHVAEEAQNSGVGSSLIKVAEDFSFAREKGISAIARESGEFMPLSFFEHMGYQISASRRDEYLVYKSKVGSAIPSFIPIGYQPILLKNRTSIVYFHFSQCPRSGWALQQLKKTVKTHRDRILLKVLNTGDRKEIERLGIAHEAYVNGRPTGRFPQNPGILVGEIEDELAVL